MADPEKQPPPEYSATAPQAQSAGTVTFNISYVKSPRGIIKIVEIFLLMIAFSCMADVGCFSTYHYSSCGRRSFFLFSTVVPWLICIVIFIFYLFCLVEKIPQLNWPLTVMLNSIIWAIVILISSSLLAENILPKKNYTAAGMKVYNNSWAAAVFGFFSVIAFFIDAFFHYQLVRS